MSACAACGAPVVWVRTSGGRSWPLQPVPVGDTTGNIKIDRETGEAYVTNGVGTHRVHYEDCQSPDLFRKRVPIEGG